MQRAVMLGAFGFTLLGVVFWLAGGFDQLVSYAVVQQRGFQNQIALGLRGIRAGNPGAFWALMAVCFGYGFFHAIGPGHGKVVIGGYGVGAKVAALRLSAIGLLASLGQAVTAILLVYGGLWLFAMTREGLVGTAERMMAPFSYGAICLVGLWLLLRGARKLLLRPRAHAHDGSGVCDSCGHRHGPTVEEVEQASTLRDALVLIAVIAVRPCTGALFVLILTWQMGIAGAGIAGAFAMALGTGVVTIGVGLGAVGLRGGMLGGLAGSRTAAVVVPLVEIGAGAIVILLAGGLFLRAI